MIMAAGTGVLLAATMLSGPGDPPDRVEATSAFGTQAQKTATATCPPGMARYAGGGSINYDSGHVGGVALSGIVPDLAGRSVRVIATAPQGRPGDWSVTAYVLCVSSVRPSRLAAHGLGSAVAECPSPTSLFGLGFHVEDGAVREVAMDSPLSQVRVTAVDPEAEVTAIALCRPPSGRMRRESQHTDITTWPAKVTGRESDPDVTTFAVGATVTGPLPAGLDAIVPHPEGESWARATLLPSHGQAARTAQGGDGGTLTMEAALIGTFH